MVNEDLETKARKAVLIIAKKVADINNVLCDLGMKLCHIIKYRKDYYSLPDGNDYYK